MTEDRAGVDRYDFVIIGAGPAGEAAAFKARELGATVAIVDRRWFGGSCPHIGCVPSKALLHAARRHLDEPGYDWARASARRDYMVNRPAGSPEPDDGSHVRALEAAGAVALRGTARIVGPGRVEVRRRRRRADRDRARGDDRGRIDLEGPPDRGPRRRPDLDEPRRDPRPGAAAQPARPGRRADRLRAGPGLRPIRGAHGDRPVRTAAHAHRPPAELGHDRDRPSARRGERADRCPGGPGARRSGIGRRRRHRARRRVDGGGACHPPRGRP